MSVSLPLRQGVARCGCTSPDAGRGGLGGPAVRPLLRGVVLRRPRSAVRHAEAAILARRQLDSVRRLLVKVRDELFLGLVLRQRREVLVRTVRLGPAHAPRCSM